LLKRLKKGGIEKWGQFVQYLIF